MTAARAEIVCRKATKNAFADGKALRKCLRKSPLRKSAEVGGNAEMALLSIWKRKEKHFAEVFAEVYGSVCAKSLISLTAEVCISPYRVRRRFARSPRSAALPIPRMVGTIILYVGRAKTGLGPIPHGALFLGALQ